MKASSPIKPILTSDVKLKINARGIYSNCLLSWIKLVSYGFSYSQAVKTDLIYSLLGSVNSFFRYLKVPNVTTTKDKFFHKSLENRNFQSEINSISQAKAIAPGLLFMSAGLYNICSPAYYMLGGFPEAVALSLSTKTFTSLTLAGMAQLYSYYKTLGILLQDHNLGFFKRMKSRIQLNSSFFKDKTNTDPSIELIIMENVLAISSALVSLVTYSICYSTGLHSIDTAGQIINGCIQVYLGYLVSKEQTHILIGSKLKKDDVDKIIKIITVSKEIEKVDKFKSGLSNGKLKISAEIKLNDKILTKYVLKRLEKNLKDSGMNQEELKRTVAKFTQLLLAKTTEICESSEKRIQEAYEYAHSIDIEKGTAPLTPEETKNVERIVNDILKEENIHQEKIHQEKIHQEKINQ